MTYTIYRHLNPLAQNELVVKTKTEKLGKVLSSQRRINGKVPVYLVSGDRVLCEPGTLEVEKANPPDCSRGLVP